MIDTADIKVGRTIYYQQPHMARAELGVITGAILSRRVPELSLIQILFLRDRVSRSCYPRDLYWPVNLRPEERVKWLTDP